MLLAPLSEAQLSGDLLAPATAGSDSYLIPEPLRWGRGWSEPFLFLAPWAE